MKTPPALNQWFLMAAMCCCGSLLPLTAQDEVTEDTPSDTPAETADAAEGETAAAQLKDDTKEVAKELKNLIKSRVEEKDYDGLQEKLKEMLTESYPKLFTEGGELSKMKVKGNAGQSALSAYACLSLLKTLPADTEESRKDAYAAWLLTGKQHGAAFVRGIAKADKEDINDMFLQLLEAYQQDPKKADKQIKNITNPAPGANRRFYPHSQQEITSTLKKINSTSPRGGADKDQQDAINTVNSFRYLSGLSHNVTYSSALAKEAEEAAKACKQAGHIAHDLGHNTDKCNLFSGANLTMANTASGYVEDPGENNRERRGHRAWVLLDKMNKTAFGKDGNFQAMRTGPGTCTDMASRPKNGTPYPGRGYYPKEYLLGTGWSYYAPSSMRIADNTKVEMWMLKKSIKSAPDEKELAKATSIPVGKVFTHTDNSFPVGNSLVWEPDYSKFKKSKDGKYIGTYWVRITSGESVYEYVVDLF